MSREHAKVFEDGKPVFKMLDGFGRPGRDVETEDWEMAMYINYCLFPLSECVKRMINESGDGGVISEYANILERLYDAANVQLVKMIDAIDKDVGQIRIVTTNEDCRGGFLKQDFLEVYVKKVPDEQLMTPTIRDADAHQKGEAK